MERQGRGAGPVAIGVSPAEEGTAARRADGATVVGTDGGTGVGGNGTGSAGDGTRTAAEPVAPTASGVPAGTPAHVVARLERRLPRADLCAVGAAREALRDFLRRRVTAPVLETAELLMSELVTNALVHTEHDAVLAVTLTERHLRVEVRDFASHGPALSGPAADGTHGRGLILVQALADAWGVSAHEVGKSVWYELGADAA